jgi:uroporphyrinogen-III synthase
MQRVFVIRESGTFDESLRLAGLKTVNIPAIETRPVDESQRLAELLEGSSDLEGIFVSSAIAAEILAKELRFRGINFQGTLFVVGESSLRFLEGRVRCVFKDRSFPSAKELIEEISDEDILGRRYLFVRGTRSLGLINERLSGVATLEEVVVYRNEDREITESERAILFNASEFGSADWMCFFSPSGAESLIRQLGIGVVSRFNIAAIGKTTADFLKSQMIEVAFISSDPSAEVFAREIQDIIVGRVTK